MSRKDVRNKKGRNKRKEIKHWLEEMDAASSDSISKLFILGFDNLDAKMQGQYETFQDLSIDKATERLMLYAGEMVGKLGKNERDDDKNDSDDENDKAKKRLQGKFALECFGGACVR